MLIYTRNILQLILSASKGWEDVSATGSSPHRLLHTGTYPYMLLASLSVFVRLIYQHDASLPYLIEMGIVTFVSFFIAVYFALMMFKTFFYHFCEGEPNERKFSTVILYVVGLLCLSTLICNMLPEKLGLDYLLPLAVSLILWKANIYLRVDSSKDLAYILFALVSVILPPVLIQRLFSEILG